MNEIDIKELSFKVLNDERKEIDCTLIGVYTDESDNKTYIAYTMMDKDIEGNTIVRFGELNKNGESYNIKPIMDEELEKSLIENYNKTML